MCSQFREWFSLPRTKKEGRKGEGGEKKERTRKEKKKEREERQRKEENIKTEGKGEEERHNFFLF